MDAMGIVSASAIRMVEKESETHRNNLGVFENIVSPDIRTKMNYNLLKALLLL